MGDLVLVNAAAVLTGGGTNYTVELTPHADGVLSVTVAAGSFTDLSGNLNAAPSNIQSAVFDGPAPTVKITGLPEAFTAQTVLTASITFSEAVAGFERSDLKLGNAAVVSFSGSGTSYFVGIQPFGKGGVTLQVSANAARDAAGNGNTASEIITVRNETVEQTQRQIAQFMTGRANQLVANQPDVTCQLKQTCVGGSAQANVTPGRLAFNFNARPQEQVWFQVSGTRTNNGSTQSDYLFGAFGTQRAINDNTLVGLLFGFDHVAQSDGASSVKGTGAMLQPFYVTRLPDQPLYFEGRLVAGMSHDRIQPFGTYTDDFETRRLLLQLKISGYLEYGETTVTPSLAGSYTSDKQLAYTDSSESLISEQSVALGQLELGLNF